MTSNTPSREFFDLIKAIGEAKSKQDEDRIIYSEIAVLKSKIGGTDVSKRQMSEYVIRMMYCELLGHDAAFGHIHAVNMCQVDNPMYKRIGYLACSLLLNPDHELIILLVNTLQRDLKSPNHLKICAALTACCRLINSETLPAVCDMVIALLDHEREIVRKKAIVALHRFIQIDPELIPRLDEKFRRVLCDKDPSVMSAALNVFHHMVQDEALHAGLKDLVPSLVSILKQVADHRLPKEYDYHRVPAPWTQIKLLQILAALGQDDQVTSEGMYGILEQTMRTANNNLSIGFAITYECVRTIARIYPNPSLSETAAKYISTMITSDNQNLKYLGVTGLAELVKVSPKYAAQHQMAVLDCLEDPDDSLKRKTLDLLYRMTSPQNVLVIAEKLLSYLKTTTDVYLREELVSRVTLLAERYAPDNEWFINTMTQVFELGGELVRPETAHNLVRLIAEGSSDDDEADNQLRHHAVMSYLDLLDRRSLPDILLKTIAWVVGEYAYLVIESGDWTIEQIEERICRLIERKYVDVDTRRWGVSALTKLVASNGSVATPYTMTIVHRYSKSPDTELQERCMELEQLVNHADTMAIVLPLDASCEDIEVDMSFLDHHVEAALSQGASPYLTIDEREDLDLDVGSRRKTDTGPKLKMTSYPAPEERVRAVEPVVQPTTPAEPPALEEMVPSVKRKWGKGGYKSNPDAPATQPASEPVQQPSQFDDTPDYSAPVQDYSHEDEEVEEEEPAPKPLTERERLAASLFGGEAPAPSPTRRSRGGRAARASRKSKPVQPEAQSQAQPQEPKPQPVKTQSDIDLLGDIFGGTPAPVPAKPTASLTNIDDDLLGFSAAPAASTTVAGMDLVDDLLSPMSSTSVGAAHALSAPQPTGGVEPTVMPPTPLIVQLLGDSPCHPTKGSQIIITDNNIVVTEAKAFCPDMLAIVLSVFGQSDLSNVSIAVSGPPGIGLLFTSDPNPESQQVSTATWRSVPEFQRIMHVVRLSCAPVAQAGLKITISYRDAMKNARSTSATVALSMSDMMRPHTTLTTAEFSATWPSLKLEKRARVNSSSLTSASEYATRLEERAHIRVIESIGTEIIAAGMIAGTSDVCLVHGNFTAADGRRAVVITVRSKNKKLTDMLAMFLTQIMV